MRVTRIQVRHSTGSYPVLIGPGILDQLGSVLRQCAPGRRPVVITDRNVAGAVSVGGRWPRLIVPAGESAKTRSQWASLTDRLVRLGYGRDTVIVAVGGGVVGDLAGFVAATYLRGVPLVLVPTSLLAMVDASVGGKTGVNTRQGKNLVGAFHPPSAVLIDPRVLRTLPPKHYRAGLVEATKHGLVADRRYRRYLERRLPDLFARDPATITRLVAGSVAIKARIVADDERELGRRAVLNAGHTVGHAIEQVSGYRVGHGDAVAVGLLVEAMLAVDRGELSMGEVEALARWFGSIGVPLRRLMGGDERLLAAMARDKKVVRGELRFALFSGRIAVASRASGWTVGCSRTSVRQALAATRQMLADPSIHTVSTPRGPVRRRQTNS